MCVDKIINNISKTLYNVTMLLNVTLASNDAAYTPCLQPQRKLILAVIVLNFSQINLNMMETQKIET